LHFLPPGRILLPDGDTPHSGMDTSTFSTRLLHFLPATPHFTLLLHHFQAFRSNFGLLLHYFRSLLQHFGSLLHYFGPLLQHFRSLLHYFYLLMQYWSLCDTEFWGSITLLLGAVALFPGGDTL
jgi:hypothetical protein